MSPGGLGWSAPRSSGRRITGGPVSPSAQPQCVQRRLPHTLFCSYFVFNAAGQIRHLPGCSPVSASRRPSPLARGITGTKAQTRAFQGFRPPLPARYAQGGAGAGILSSSNSPASGRCGGSSRSAQARRGIDGQLRLDKPRGSHAAPGSGQPRGHRAGAEGLPVPVLPLCLVSNQGRAKGHNMPGSRTEPGPWEQANDVPRPGCH